MKGKGVDLFSTLFPLFDSENMEPIRHEPICPKRKLINIFICGKCFIEFFYRPLSYSRKTHTYRVAYKKYGYRMCVLLSSNEQGLWGDLTGFHPPLKAAGFAFCVSLINTAERVHTLPLPLYNPAYPVSGSIIVLSLQPHPLMMIEWPLIQCQPIGYQCEEKSILYIFICLVKIDGRWGIKG